MLIIWKDGKNVKCVRRPPMGNLSRLKWNGKRPDLIILTSQERREYTCASGEYDAMRDAVFNNWFNKVAVNLINEDGIVIVDNEDGYVEPFGFFADRIMESRKRNDEFVIREGIIKRSPEDSVYACIKTGLFSGGNTA